MAGRLLSFNSRRNKRKREQESPASTRSLFHKFRRILELNNDVMTRMANLESALGGEYIFDAAFLTRSVREMSGLVHQVAYSLNAMTDDRYVQLYDRFEYLKGILYDILSGGLGPEASRLTMAFPDIHWENLPLTGMANASLAELKRMPDMGGVDGFVVTVTGCREILEHGLTQDIQTAIRQEAAALFQRLGRTVPLKVSASPAGTLEPAAGLPGAETDAASLPQTVLDACNEASAMGWNEVAVGVREHLPNTFRGHLQTCCQEAPPGTMHLELTGPDGAERTLLRKAHPFPSVESDIIPKEESTRLPDGARALRPTGDGLLRGSALLRPRYARRIAEAGLVLERALGSPQGVHFCLDEDGLPRVVEVTPVPPAVEDDSETEALAEALEQATVLLQGGDSAQSGAAAGAIIHVDESHIPEKFPLGAVAVARTASPQLAPILRRAGAIVTELGSTIGHLATVAREYRIPAIFGAAGALQALPEGTEVTVDASTASIYEGSLDMLLAQRRAGSELFAVDPEFTTLRRLLQFIMPLRLTDADSEEFAPENCRSYHDIIHFAHERSVEELLQVHSGRGAGPAPHRLQMGIPLDIGMVDAGGGLVEDVGEVATRDEIRSEPMRCFLAGLRYAWDNRKSIQISMRDVFSGMQRTTAMLQTPSDSQARNLAILADGYCNISLHMGYHYNVIDAFMQDNPNQNHIYFRFAGGFADSERKNRRAELIQRILAPMQFHVERKADLVTGRLKIVDKKTMARVLEQLGMLTSFTRQLDISMGRESSLLKMEEAFHDLVRRYASQEES